MSDDRRDSQKPAQLFTLRVWNEEVGDAKTEWRGRVQHVATGETRYFRTWEALVQFLTEQLGTVAENLPRPPRP
jgi:hypothetical protein